MRRTRISSCGRRPPIGRTPARNRRGTIPTDASHHARLTALLERALGLPPDRREAFVEEVCRSDAMLGDELRSLIATHAAADAYFEGLSARLVMPALASLAAQGEDRSGDDLAATLRERLAGAYGLERELLGGGMSRVFLARDLRLKRQVVIKVLPPEAIPTGRAERFGREIELAARLQHPHVVPLLAADSLDDIPYYTMPFVAGESLRQRLARERPLPVEEATRIWRDVLDALAHAHAHGIIHRDIKPANILLSGRNALVTDLGIASAIETASADDPALTSGFVIGTPAYMAPEQAAGERAADPRVDVYAAGAVMYEMLAGRPPFVADSTHQLLRAKATQDPPALIRPDAPAELVLLVMRCLAREAAERPASADAVLAQLEGVGAQGVASAASAPDPAVGRRLRRALPYLVGGLLIAAVVVVGVRRTGSSAGMPRPAAIAVLPLANLSSDPADAPLADAMTQELTAVLGRNPELRVIATTSVSALHARGLGITQIADSLRVTHVLEGSVQRAGPRLRMQLRLVDAGDGSTRWSETFDREFADVFEVQAEIARAVGAELTTRLASPDTVEPGFTQPTPDIAAYEWYLRGMDLALMRTDSGRRLGVEYFERAIAIDSTYAGAWAGLVRMYVHMAHAAPTAEKRRWLARADDAATRAVALDDSQADGHAALAWARLGAGHYRGAEAAFQRATALDPGVERGHEGLARVYMMLGRPTEQLAQARLGLRIDPLSHSAIRELALALATNGRCEESLDPLQSLKDLTPPAGVAGVVRGQCYASLGRWAEAIAEFRWAADYDARAARAFLGHALARAGRPTEAAAVLDELLAGREHSHGSFGIAVVYAGMRDYDRAFAWLDRSIDDQSMNPYVMHPMFADLHGDPRFERLRQRLHRPGR